MNGLVRFLMWCALGWIGAGSAIRAEDFAELRWDYQLVHYTPAEGPVFDAWVISPPTVKGESESLAVLLDDISRQPNSRIAHIYLSKVMLRPDLQEAVMKFMTGQPEFQKHPPPTGFGRWEFKNSDRMRVLVAKALMGSPFVADCNALLGKQGKSVRSVSIEKLFFTKEEGKWGWNASVWLMVDPLPKPAVGR
jgi:hypothetical protein